MIDKPVLKQHLTDLAVFGGPAAISRDCAIGQNIDIEAFLDKVRGIYRRRHLTNNGPLVRELERRLADLHRTKHCVAVATLGLGLSMLLQVCGGGRGGSVVMPSIGRLELPYLARWAGLLPQFADVNPQSHTLDPADVRSRISRDTRCILAVARANAPGFVDELCLIANEHELPIIFDAADAPRSTHSGSPMGPFGDAEAFSLGETSGILDFESAYVTTDDDALAHTLRRQRDFNAAGREPTDLTGSRILGLNAKLNELHAAVSLLLLDRMEADRTRPSGALQIYREIFADLPGISVVPARGPVTERRNDARICLSVAPEWELSRDQTVQLLQREGFDASPCQALHRLAAWSAPSRPNLPIAERVGERCFELAIRPLDSDAHAMAHLLQFMSARRSEVARRMADNRG